MEASNLVNFLRLLIITVVRHDSNRWCWRLLVVAFSLVCSLVFPFWIALRNRIFVHVVLLISVYTSYSVSLDRHEVKSSHFATPTILEIRENSLLYYCCCRLIHIKMDR